MNVILYREEYDQVEFLDHFMDSYYSSQMKYQASQLLDQGLSTKDINEAVRKAMTSAQTAGMNIRQHFFPLYTQSKGGLVRDCKLSKMGYALVLLNANVQHPVVAKFQIRVLNNYFEK